MLILSAPILSTGLSTTVEYVEIYMQFHPTGEIARTKLSDVGVNMWEKGKDYKPCYLRVYLGHWLA